jgi:nickel/cobalt transporter (NicO) family protein
MAIADGKNRISLPIMAFMIACFSVACVIGAGALLSYVFGLDSSTVPVGKSPFSVGIAEGGVSVSGFSGWILAVQSRFSQAMMAAIDTFKTSSGAGWALFGLSLAYGIFHAAGPGHGKAVIAAYGIAEKKALASILGMAGAAAMFQACVAITLVSALSLVVHATASTMRDTTQWIETLSFTTVTGVGAILLWKKANQLSIYLLGDRRIKENPTDSHNDDHDHDHGHHHHHHNDACDHNHAPMAPPGSGLRGALAAIFAAGIRPCSGSILILVFAFSQGLITVGILAALAIGIGTGITTGALAVLAIYATSTASRLAGKVDAPRVVLMSRGIEVLAAAFVTALGIALLSGLSQAGLG